MPMYKIVMLPLIGMAFLHDDYSLRY